MAGLRLFPANMDDYYKSDHWTVVKVQAKKRDTYRCMLCYRGPDQVRLDVHHRTYNRLGYEALSDVVTLCQECHAFADQQRRKYSVKIRRAA